MALKSGRVGVARSEVDSKGKIRNGGSSDAYTKAQADAKFETKEDIGGVKFRDNNGTIQYKLPSGDWSNFSGGIDISEPYEAYGSAYADIPLVVGKSYFIVATIGGNVSSYINYFTSALEDGYTAVSKTVRDRGSVDQTICIISGKAKTNNIHIGTSTTGGVLVKEI